MNAAEAAALIVAVFWALLVSVGVFVLFRLGRLLGESSRLVADLRERSDMLLQRAQTAVDGAQAAVDRAGGQLDRTESVTASMDELGTGMAELAGQVTALAGLGRAIAGGRWAASVPWPTGYATLSACAEPVPGARWPAASWNAASSRARNDPPRLLADGRGDHRYLRLPACLRHRPPALCRP